MSTRIVAEFEVTAWDNIPDDPPVGKALVKKSYQGPVTGTSVADLITCGANETQRAYVASDRFTGEVEGRAGGFVMHHGATQDGDDFNLFGHIVPGSGTGDLTGIRGSVRFEHDENGAKFTLDYDLPERAG
jgi:hypothetical protein